jgi:RNA polymerase sigma-70 factor (ECF subfamily)
MESRAERIPDEGPDDATLVAAAQRGDPAAFGVLVRRHRRGVLRLAWALTHDAATAEDLAQEAFVRAWGAIARFDRSRPLRPWLAAIVTRLAYSLFRRRRRRPETSIETLLESGRDWGVHDDPADHAAHAERDERLRACVAELAPEHRAVLALRAVQDLSYEEIAQALGVPVGTVMSRLSRARAELRRRLAERTGGES